MASETRQCDCKNDYMDQKYGRGNRVHNQTKKSPPTFRCVVCRKERS